MPVDPRFITFEEAQDRYGGGGGGSFTSTHAARVDPNGSDSTGVVGDFTKPFATTLAAVAAMDVLSIQTGTVVLTGDYQDSSSAITTAVPILTFLNWGDPLLSLAFDSITFTASGTVRLTANNVGLGSITADSCSSLTSNLINSAFNNGAIAVVSSASGSVAVNCFGDPGISQVTIGPSGGGTSVYGFDLSGFSVNINDPGQSVNIQQCVVENVTAAVLNRVDAITAGTVTLSSPPANNYAQLLDPSTFNFSTLPQGTTQPSIPIGSAWIDTTAGANIVKVKLS